MEEIVKVKKRLRVLLVIFIVVFIPAYFRIFNTDEFASISAYVIAVLFVSGVLAGVILAALKDYFRLKSGNTK